VLAALVLVAPPLAGQATALWGGGLGLGIAQWSAIPGYSEHLTGTGFGAEGGARIGRGLLHLRYLSGALGPAAGNVPARDVVDARVGVGVQALTWLTLEAGPHVRAFSAAGATERWVLWEVRSRVEASLIGPEAIGHAEVWRAFSSTVNLADAIDYVQGGAIGLTFRSLKGPYRLGVDYEIEHAALNDGKRGETWEGLVVRLTIEP